MGTYGNVITVAAMSLITEPLTADGSTAADAVAGASRDGHNSTATHATNPLAALTIS